jgi:hypothetical protein
MSGNGSPGGGEAAGMSDHDRVMSSGALLGTIAGMAGIGWLEIQLPALASWALEWAIILAVCCAMALWKRAWYAWAAFWGMAVLCPLAGILHLAGAMTGQWSAASWWVACAMVFIWYWLVRMPRLQPAVQAAGRREIHVFHHVIHHGPELAGWAAAEIDGGTAVPVSARKVTPGAITPRKVIRGAITGTRVKELRAGSK